MVCSVCQAGGSRKEHWKLGLITLVFLITLQSKVKILGGKSITKE